MTLKEESITARKAWHGASCRKLADHIFIHRCETERELEVGPGYKPLKPPRVMDIFQQGSTTYGF